MHIIYVPESFPQPSETFVINEIDGLLELGYQVTIVPRIQGDIENTQHARLKKIMQKIKLVYEQVDFDTKAFLYALKYGGQVWQGWRPNKLISHIKSAVQIAKHSATIKAQNPDLVLIHFGYDNALAGVIAAKELNIPSILWLHGSDMHIVPHRNLIWITQHVSRVITHSKYAMGLLRGLGVQKSIDISCLGVDIKKFKPLAHNVNKQLVMICVARLGHYKNHKTIIQIFKEVNEQIPHIALWLVGDGPNRKELEKLVADWQLDNVVFWGALAQERIVELLQQASIKVLLSKKEGFPVVLMESQSVGLPSVVTSVGGMGEVVENNKTGYLFDLNGPGFEEKVVNSIVELLQNEALREQMGKAARLRAEILFDEKHHIERMDKLIKQLLKAEK